MYITFHRRLVRSFFADFCSKHDLKEVHYVMILLSLYAGLNHHFIWTSKLELYNFCIIIHIINRNLANSKTYALIMRIFPGVSNAHHDDNY